MKCNCSFLVLSCCFKKHMTAGHQTFHGHLIHPGRKPSVNWAATFRAGGFPGIQCPLWLGPTYISDLAFPLIPVGHLTFQPTQLLAVPHTIPLSPCPCALAKFVLPLRNVILAAINPTYISRYLEIFSEGIYTEFHSARLSALVLGQIQVSWLSFSYRRWFCSAVSTLSEWGNLTQTQQPSQLLATDSFQIPVSSVCWKSMTAKSSSGLLSTQGFPEIEVMKSLDIS